jgi:hypothetical protein
LPSACVCCGFGAVSGRRYSLASETHSGLAQPASLGTECSPPDFLNPPNVPAAWPFRAFAVFLNGLGRAGVLLPTVGFRGRGGWRNPSHCRSEATDRPWSHDPARSISRTTHLHTMARKGLTNKH